MKDNPFNAGDVVVCVNPPVGFKRGGVYTITGVHDDRVVVDEFSTGYYYWRFELAPKATLLKRYFGMNID